MAYGKLFEGAFVGSMVGAGAHVFAVWCYVIAHARPPEGVVSLNPRVLAVVLGEPETRIREALDYLLAPDPASRSQEDEGRRLIALGAYEYRVVQWAKYRAMRSAEDRRAQNRDAQARFRAARKQSVSKE